MIYNIPHGVRPEVLLREAFRILVPGGRPATGPNSFRVAIFHQVLGILGDTLKCPNQGTKAGTLLPYPGNSISKNK